jgi:hypothetical protein
MDCMSLVLHTRAKYLKNALTLIFCLLYCRHCAAKWDFGEDREWRVWYQRFMMHLLHISGTSPENSYIPRDAMNVALLGQDAVPILPAGLPATSSFPRPTWEPRQTWNGNSWSSSVNQSLPNQPYDARTVPQQHQHGLDPYTMNSKRPAVAGIRTDKENQEASTFYKNHDDVLLFYCFYY